MGGHDMLQTSAIAREVGLERERQMMNRHHRSLAKAERPNQISELTWFGGIKVTPRACYSRSTTDEPKTTTFVEVDEAGTEAAAATAVIMQATAMPADPIEVTIDRPFLFLIRDIETGTVLFLGRVMNPA